MDHNHWSDEIEEICEKLRINCVNLSEYHRKRYYTFKSYGKWFRLPLIILASVNSTASVGLQPVLDQQIISGIKVNGYKFGINIREVDPSYTSIIGKNKYSIPVGLSIHQAAAYVIARRGYEYKEKIKKIIQTNKTGQVFILAVPAWKQCLKDKRSSNGFKRWLSGKIGKSSSITEKTNGAERYVPHNKLGLSKILCDSDRNKRALN